MRVAFLMGLFPKDNRNEIIKNSRGPIQFAADALEWGYVKGISEQNIKCELFNAPFIGSYLEMGKFDECRFLQLYWI